MVLLVNQTQYSVATTSSKLNRPYTVDYSSLAIMSKYFVEAEIGRAHV